MIAGTTRSADSPSGKLAAAYGAVRRQWAKLERDPGDDPERALGSNDQIDHAIVQTAREAQQAVARRDHTQTNHGVTGDPVLEGVGTAGVGGHVAADRGGRFG